MEFPINYHVCDIVGDYHTIHVHMLQCNVKAVEDGLRV